MKKIIVDGIEILVAEPGGAVPLRTLLFVHGAFAGAWVWAERFLPHCATRGYRAAALSLRGHGESAGRAHLDLLSIDDFVDDVAAAIAALGGEVVLIGHSMGGFVVQKYLERHRAPAAVLMSSVPPQGLLASTFHLVMRRPGLLVELNRLLGGGKIDPEVVRDALFAHDIPLQKVRDYALRMAIESQRAIWDMTMFNLVRLHAVQRTPLLVLGTDEDQLIPPFLVQATARSYGVADRLFAGFGHAFMLEPGCERIADAVIEWLAGL